MRGFSKGRRVDSAATWATQRDKFLPRILFCPKEIGLPKYISFSNKKVSCTCQEKSIFHPKKKMFYSYHQKKKNNFLNKSFFNTCLKKPVFHPKKIFLIFFLYHPEKDPYTSLENSILWTKQIFFKTKGSSFTTE